MFVLPSAVLVLPLLLLPTAASRTEFSAAWKKDSMGVPEPKLSLMPLNFQQMELPTDDFLETTAYALLSTWAFKATVGKMTRRVNLQEGRETGRNHAFHTHWDGDICRRKEAENVSW